MMVLDWMVAEKGSAWRRFGVVMAFPLVMSRRILVNAETEMGSAATCERKRRALCCCSHFATSCSIPHLVQRAISRSTMLTLALQETQAL